MEAVHEKALAASSWSPPTPTRDSPGRYGRRSRVRPGSTHAAMRTSPRRPSPRQATRCPLRPASRRRSPGTSRSRRARPRQPQPPGPPRDAAHQPGLVQRGSPAAPGASAGSVVPWGPAAPLHINRCGRGIASASVFATAFGQPASRSASGNGLSQPPTLTRGL